MNLALKNLTIFSLSGRGEKDVVQAADQIGCRHQSNLVTAITLNEEPTR
jgi:hypothetical protein